MAHFAIPDKNGVVIEVRVGIAELGDDEDAHSKAWGVPVKRTSYNTAGGAHLLGGTPFRKNYAGIGFTYDGTRDAFIFPKRAPFAFPSWVLDEDTCLWVAPVPKPKDGQDYTWDELLQTWMAK